MRQVVDDADDQPDKSEGAESEEDAEQALAPLNSNSTADLRSLSERKRLIYMRKWFDLFATFLGYHRWARKGNRSRSFALCPRGPS